MGSVGPWTFEVLGLAEDGDLVEVTWRQTGAVVERRSRELPGPRRPITEYCIEFSHEGAHR